MKNMIQGIALLALLSIPLYAQAKPAVKPVAKPAVPAVPAEVAKPAAPTVATPVTPTAPAMPPAPGAIQGNAAIYEFWKNAGVTASVWGAYNYATKSTFSQAIDSAFSTTGTYSSVSFGARGWYGNKTSQIGISVGYQQMYNNTATITGMSQTEKLTYIPTIVMARYFIMPGLYAGAGAGYSVGLLKADNSVTSKTTTFGSPIVGALVGYDFEITPGFSVGAFVNITYSFAKVNQAINSSTAADYTANALNIMPGLSLNYTF